MRIHHALIATMALAACAQPENTTTPTPAPSTARPTPQAQAQAPDTAQPTAPIGSVVLHSLAGSGLKFNGVYDSHTQGDIHYVMRFFERGNVALVAGRQRTGDKVDLRNLLTIDAKSGKDNLHNVPVEQRGDSLFFTTMATRGEILYAGVVAGDSLRFLKHSRVTGKKAVVSYGFVPDGTKWP
jgi:hypothetical protein